MKVIYSRRSKGRVQAVNIQCHDNVWKYKKLDGCHDLVLMNMPGNPDYYKYSDELLEAREVLDTYINNIEGR